MHGVLAPPDAMAATFHRGVSPYAKRERTSQTLNYKIGFQMTITQLSTGQALPEDQLETIGLTFGGCRPSIVLVTNRVLVKDLEV